MSLRGKIFLLTATILVCSIVLGALLIHTQVQRAMLVGAERSLETTLEAIEQLARARAANRESQAGIISKTTPLTEVLATGDRGAVQAVADAWFPHLRQVDLFMILDAEGRTLAAAGQVPVATPDAEISAAIGSLPAAVPEDHGGTAGGARPTALESIWILGDELLEITDAPLVAEDGRYVGAVILASKVGHAVADRLQRVSRSQVVILADNRIVASSLPLTQAEAVVAHFPELAGGALGSVHRELEVARTPYLGALSSLPVSYGGGRCNHVVLRSLADTRKLQRKVLGSLAAIGTLALAGAFGLTWLGARHIAQPLHRLAETMSKIARSGELEAPAPAAGGREVRLFQEAFQRMLKSLESSQREKERSYVEAVGAVMAAVDRRDQESAGHSYRVASYAVALGSRMDLSETELRAMEWGALLHDVGKIAVPDEILRKRGPLTEKEWQIMRQHPSWGYEMLADVQFLKPALEIVYNHHERWDGTGYPRRLKGEQIPLPARVFALVDTYDAITSDRHYRRAGSHQNAVAELRRVAGSQLDPRVVEAFLEIPQVELRRLRTLTQSLRNVPRMPPPLRDLLGPELAAAVESAG